MEGLDGIFLEVRLSESLRATLDRFEGDPAYEAHSVELFPAMEEVGAECRRAISALRRHAGAFGDGQAGMDMDAAETAKDRHLLRTTLFEALTERVATARFA